jgi:hypothetical protein
VIEEPAEFRGLLDAYVLESERYVGERLYLA